VNIREYNKHKNGKLPYILCVVDEYADLAGNKVMAEMVNYIARKARAVGVHLILACQRPDADILNGKIKANIGNIVGLKCTTPINSRIIIDKEGLEVLRGYGHGILKCGSIYTEMQSMMIEVEEAKQLVQHTFVSKAQKPEAVAVKPMLRGYL
jgi:S-DNA-T family DNA segregation ATPase FtsK/SpoIIIE